jgi:hypothetical protein
MTRWYLGLALVALAALGLIALLLVYLAALAGGWGQLFWWGVTAWIALRIVGLAYPPRRGPVLPPRRHEPAADAHDAAVSVAAVLGVRDALHRK